ncbi:hypothetical protein HPB47_018109, partial [Ixodes persulcatus]
GDSGGPLQCMLDDGRWYLAGVVSWGAGCGRPRKPAMFVRVSSYLDWIRLAMTTADGGPRPVSADAALLIYTDASDLPVFTEVPSQNLHTSSEEPGSPKADAV